MSGRIEPVPLEPLPIDRYLPDIVETLQSSGMLVLVAEPGAGKTTRVATALLDAGLANLPDGKLGQIVVLQPRRIAARAAASRMSNERGNLVGGEVGYQVRFEKRVSRATRILVCTEGLFLRRIQEDPFLQDTAVVVFDEFHERSAYSDLALAMVAQVRLAVRPDLRILVMSATLDTGAASGYLGNCPTIKCPGRTHPIRIEYLKTNSSQPLERLVADGSRLMLAQTPGDLLIFLPGIAEIRDAQSELERDSACDSLSIMPLYGDLPLEQQQAVLLPSQKRKIVLATNVAETSITIDGITAVIDSGLCRITKLNSRLGMNRLELSRISKASADQRAGRAGRNSPGSCMRLWTEREHGLLRDFEVPEIARVELSQIALQLITWGEHNIRAFPWFEVPPDGAIDQALELLERLGALANGSLTECGKQMAALPLQPRTARLFLEGKRLGYGSRAAICAALLEERAPFKRSAQKTLAQHHGDSDVLDQLEAVEHFATTGFRHSQAGELLSAPTRQILRAAEQIERNLDEQAEASAESKEAVDVESSSDTAILKAILAAYPDRVCIRREAAGRRAIMVGGRGVRLADESTVGAGELFVAVELLDSGSTETLVRQASRIEKDWLPKTQLTESLDTTYDAERQKVTAVRRLRFFDLIIDQQSAPLPPDLDAAAILAEAAANHFDLNTLVNEDARRYLARIGWLKRSQLELDLPDFGTNPWPELLPEWCTGCTSIEEMRSAPLVEVVKGRLTREQVHAIERFAPDSIVVPSGRRVKLDYELDRPPVLAVRIQELFGLSQTPCVANSSIPVLLHLLAPNNRIQQITSDLASFWKNTYPEVVKELKSRYPKHSWPSDPMKAQPEIKPRRTR
jgi:ATP-dependent helicase HrpB